MLLPKSEIALGGVLRCPRREIEVGPWQAHVVKHPLGGHWLRRCAGKAAWNAEGWDRLEPPVVTEVDRASLLASIQGFATETQRCGARELWGKPPKGDDEPCYACKAPLVKQCEKVVNAAGAVGAVYADRVEMILRSFSDAVQVSKKDLGARLMAFLRAPEKLEGLSVLHVGLDRGEGNKRIARISGHDGVVVEFYLLGQDELKWRTTYREPQAMANVGARLSFLQRAPHPDNRIEVLSDAALVTRGWWETHGV